MQTQITARHFTASPYLQTRLSERLAKLERYYDGITEARVILDETPSGAAEKNAEVILHVYRQNLTAHTTAPTHEQAVDACCRSLRRQLLRYKSKLRSRDKFVRK
jgi:putative sigma-54 modulation protein